MREIFDYLDAADPWAAIAVITLIALVLEHVSNALERRAYRTVSRTARAHERIQGYAHGYRDGRLGHMPAYRPPDGVVPEAFTRESYRS